MDGSSFHDSTSWPVAQQERMNAGADATSHPRLSVVVGSVNCARSITASLRAILASTAGIPTEIVVVDASSDATPALVAGFRGTRLLQVRRKALVPELWAIGIRECSGDVIALTTGHCLPRLGWARALLTAIAHGSAGAGGAFALDAGAGRTDGAVFLLRYSAFLDGTRSAEKLPDIAADNAMYRRDVLQRYASSWQRGFWEVEFHRRLREEDGGLRFTPDAVVEVHLHARLSSYVRQRFEHGRHFGAWRVHDQRQSRFRIMAAAPLVPGVLLGRIARRALRTGHGKLFLSVLPHLVLLALAWAAGELGGAIAYRAADHVDQESAALTSHESGRR